MDIDISELILNEWGNSIDDLTLSQVGQQLEDEDGIFHGITDLSLFQCDVNLTQKPLTTDNVLEQLETNDGFGKFTSENDIENLLKPTESENTRKKNTSLGVKTFKEWGSASVSATGNPELENLTKPA
jgi:hypothetical protein